MMTDDAAWSPGPAPVCPTGFTDDTALNTCEFRAFGTGAFKPEIGPGAAVHPTAFERQIRPKPDFGFG